MKNNKKLLYSRDDIWRRINRIIKKKYKNNASAFAKNINFSTQRFMNLKYRKTVPISLVIAIKENEKLPSDFILFGEATIGFIPPELLED